MKTESEWFDYDGGHCPVSAGAEVTVRFRDHEKVKDDFHTDTGLARLWDWYHDGGPDDIIAYRVVKP